jgi:hypothetical protein
MTRIALPAILALCGLLSATPQAAAQSFNGMTYGPNNWWTGGNQRIGSPTCGAGASAYYLMPFLQNNTAYVVVNGADTTQTNTDFTWNFQFAGAAWLGWVNEYGSGVRARVFHFDNDSNKLNISQGGTGSITAPASLGVPGGFAFGSPGILGTIFGGDQLSFQSGLQIDAADVEFTSEWQAGGLDVLLSGGGRYLRLAQSYHAMLANNAPTGATETQNLDANSEFNGGGPTVAVQGRWNAGGGWAVFGMARGALLVGSTNRTITFHQVVVDPVGGLSQNNLAQTSSSGMQLLPVSELELGLEYGWGNRFRQCLLRGALVNQTYFGAGNASSGDGNLSLFGFQLTAGCCY